jgi:hypothetical protein
VGLAFFADDAKAVWESMDASVLLNGENSMMVRLHSNSSTVKKLQEMT